ncbi:hypothetical protein H4217_002599 [Coemansia sp. RSA 1939]|nr:hypothetical protein H4217_002599 [Coemansia sp. RSA 1939]KAJ2613906.1 hypothetical protein EV177_002309 [Coemansia sp. RSA 1804]KAJ2693180.1 hypothetical protein GGH99_001291 [Coemansia sp. RSA 1285]
MDSVLSGADYADVMAADFDPLQYARRVASGDNDSTANADANSNSNSNADASTDRLARAMDALAKRADALDDVLQQTVIASHADLLKQVVGVKALDASLAQVEDKVREIKAHMHSLRTRIRVPYQQSAVYGRQASNLHDAMRHVRATARFIQLVRRLQTQIPPDSGEDKEEAAAVAPDFALGALTLLDIERAVGGGDLGGIRIVDQGMATVVRPRRERTIVRAEQMLDAGIRHRNQGDIAGGLQILFNLGTLAAAVAARVRRCVADWGAAVRGRLDPKSISAFVRDHNARAKSIDGSDMVGVTGVVLARIEALVDDLLSRGLELRVLERVLARKRDVLPRFDVSSFSSTLAADPASASSAAASGNGGGATPSFSDLVAQELGSSTNNSVGSTRTVAFWWREALTLLRAEIDSACAESSVIRQMLTNSYPRVVQLFVPKLEQLQPIDMPLLWDALLGSFEAEYVARAASRIEDAVARCYPPPPPPGLVDAQERRSRMGAAAESELFTAVSVVPNRKLVAGVVRSMSTELEMAKSDARLLSAVAEAASSAARTFASVTETKIAAVTVNPSVLNPFGVPPHPLTKSLVGLLNAAEALRAGIEEFGARGLVAVDGGALGALVGNHSAGLLDTADRAITEAVYQAGTTADTPSSMPSLDLFDIASQWLQTQVLEPMRITACRQRVVAMVTKYLCAYTRVVCLTFPLTEETKLLLTGHATQFEFACSQLMAAASTGVLPSGTRAAVLSDLGKPYRALRMIRPLLFMSTGELARLVSGGDSSSNTNRDNSDDGDDDLSVVDLADHVVCRLATALLPLGADDNGADATSAASADVRRCLPHRVAQCTWTEWVSLAAGSSDIQQKQKRRIGVLVASLELLAAKIQNQQQEEDPSSSDAPLSGLFSLAQAMLAKLRSF